MSFENFKKASGYGEGALAGAVTFVVGQWATPVVASMLTMGFMSTKLLVAGLTPTVVVGYGLGAMVAMSLNRYIFKS